MKRLLAAAVAAICITGAPALAQDDDGWGRGRDRGDGDRGGWDRGDNDRGDWDRGDDDRGGWRGDDGGRDWDRGNRRRDNDDGWSRRNWRDNDRDWNNTWSWSSGRSYRRYDNDYDRWRSRPHYGYDAWYGDHYYHARRIWQGYGVPYAYSGYFSWGVGSYYPYDYRSYYVSDYYNYYLPPPPHEHVWVRHGDGAYLIALATGLIVGLAVSDGYYY